MVVFCVCVWLTCHGWMASPHSEPFFAPSEGGRQSNYISRFLSEPPPPPVSFSLLIATGCSHRSFQLPAAPPLVTSGDDLLHRPHTHAKAALSSRPPRPLWKPILIRRGPVCLEQPQNSIPQTGWSHYRANKSQWETRWFQTEASGEGQERQ